MNFPSTAFVRISGRRDGMWSAFAGSPVATPPGPN